MKPVILIIDDEEKLRGLLKRIISMEGFEVKDTGTIAQARKFLQTTSFDIVLCDVKLPDGNGVDFTKEIKTAYPHIEVILLTAYGNIPDGINAIKNGAYDYLVKGDDNEKILPLLHNITEKIVSHRSVKHLEAGKRANPGFDNIIGKSEGFQNAIKLAEKVQRLLNW